MQLLIAIPVKIIFKNVALHQSERNIFLEELVVVRRNDTSINAVMNNSKIARQM